MKKNIYNIILVVTIFIIGISNVEASSGQLRKASIKTCNGITYGQHSSDNHWHVAEEKDGKYYATGNPIYSNPCSSTNNTTSESTSNNNNTTTNKNESTSNDGKYWCQR